MRGARSGSGTARSRTAAAVAASILCGSLAGELAADPPGAIARDEEFVLRFTRPVPRRRLDSGAIAVTTPVGSVQRDPDGALLPGRALVDAATGRAVAVRPEALREYFVLVEDLPRADADRKAARVLDRAERTGNLKTLAKIDAALVQRLGAFAGCRLDDPAVSAGYPPPVPETSPLLPYRRLVAGDDVLWQSYFFDADFTAFAMLQATSEFERFFHPIDPNTGVPAPTSVLRQREHRRVLMRRVSTLVTFVPELPQRADLADAGYEAGTAYEVVVGTSLRGSAKDLQPVSGGVQRFVKGRAPFQVAGEDAFIGGSATLPPRGTRVVSVTPPNGEGPLDLTTDWEDPDNKFLVPVNLRRPFVFRLRFSAPLDPRTVDTAHFTVTKTKENPGTPQEIVVDQPQAATVTLVQRRMGEVVVVVTPVMNLDPQAQYEVRVASGTRALDGTELGSDFVSSIQ